MNFNELPSTKIGNYGEQIVKIELEKRGYVIYKPVSNCSHPIDNIVFDTNDNFIFCEVKTKPRRYMFDDTGIDIKHWRRYTKLMNKRKKPVYIFFVDEIEEWIYQADLKDIFYNKKYHEDMNEKYPKCYFQLSDMKPIRKLTQMEIDNFKQMRLELNYKIPCIEKYDNNRFFQ